MVELTRANTCERLTFCFGSASLAYLSEWLHRERNCKEHFRATLANADVAIVTADCGGRIVFLNAAAQVLLGLSCDVAIGQAIGSALFLLPQAGGCPAENTLQQVVVDDGPGRLPNELMLVTPSDKQHPVKVTISRLLNFKGQKTGRVVVFHPKPLPDKDNRAATAAQSTPETPAPSYYC